MKVAVDSGTFKSGHAIRGIGVHTEELKRAFGDAKYSDMQVDFVDFADTDLSRYDLLHYPYFSFFAEPPKYIKGPKKVVTIHDTIPLIYPSHYPPGLRGRVNFLREKKFLAKTDSVITISETSKKDICRNLRVEAEKVHVIHLAPKNIFKKINDGHFKNGLAAKYSLPSEFALYVGDINYNKNLPNLLAACIEARATLVIVGKNALKIEELAKSSHPEHQHLKDVVPLLNSKFVKRLGFVSDEDLVKLYNSASVYVFVSLYEGFGLSILEAEKCGTAVVASRIQAHVEIARKSCLFVDPEAIGSIAKGITQVLTNKPLREGLIEAGYANASRYSWKKTADLTLEVYRKTAEQIL